MLLAPPGTTFKIQNESMQIPDNDEESGMERCDSEDSDNNQIKRRNMMQSKSVNLKKDVI